MKSSPPFYEHTRTVLVNNHIHPTSGFATGNKRSKLDSEDRREKISGMSLPPIAAQLATSCGTSNKLHTMKFQRTTVNQHETPVFVSLLWALSNYYSGYKTIFMECSIIWRQAYPDPHQVEKDLCSKHVQGSSL